MKKVDRQVVNLKAGIPLDIFVKNGINYDTEVSLRYPKSEEGGKIMLTFGDANGQSISKELELLTGGQTFHQFNDEV